ncbi:UDP-N-acetyl-D-mannosaminuronic acid dehydrogenase [Micromonospora humidisoli]|uniref:Nucleotide sugar dehydrogenase n=1 Tax=Micromonospora humidisoli TaxID=2807622 RepID=A0ABS2JBB9_9ACTN|nr:MULTISPECIES: nucleotide sugar dehydrogenase [Micromonospora]MBM7083828.1 nucleotide sugar dehydrogenase [Micromonospora humidisoli]GHJ06954.1 UDP-N-acetyl-D-mannosaminuronic acid dehydrogenase [Micromonospora sp. AKA109]
MTDPTPPPTRAPADGPGGPVAVIGLGYVGLTLAVSLAQAGVPVVGVEADAGTRAALRAGTPTLFEPGVDELLRSLPADRLTITDTLDGVTPAAVVICVGTPLDDGTGRPDLRHFTLAAQTAAAAATADTLVVVRSTVPVGTTRRTLLPLLRERVDEPLLACCPERTIQGRALAELASLPQVVGGLDDRSADRARRLFARLTPEQVVTADLETAELVKLACNAHTDLLYGFGNELAMIAEAVGVDATEVIAAANRGYPRPDLARPGFVGGSCLTKDPYLLVYSAGTAGYHPPLVAAARAVNEQVPHLVTERVLKALAATGRAPADAKVLVCGMAYKGRPETDDVRGSAATVVADVLRERVRLLAGHDYLVPDDVTARLGYAPASLADGLADADVLVLLVDHPRYRADLDAALLRRSMNRPALVVDVWGDLASALSGAADVDYRRLGRG